MKIGQFSVENIFALLHIKIIKDIYNMKMMVKLPNIHKIFILHQDTIITTCVPPAPSVSESCCEELSHCLVQILFWDWD